jgi:hypothetical protein
MIATQSAVLRKDEFTFILGKVKKIKAVFRNDEFS